LQSDSQEPQETWLSIVKTQKAQSSIRAWLKKTITAQSKFLGQKIWQRELQSLKVQKENAPTDSDVCRAFNATNINSFYENLGKGNIPLKSVLDFLNQYSYSSWTKLRLLFASSESAPISIGHGERFLLNYATCCNPLPGSPSEGILISGKGIEIHSVGCKVLNKIPQEQRFALLWEHPNSSDKELKCVLQIEAVDRVAIEEDIFHVISKYNVFVKKTIFRSRKGRVDGKVDLLAFNSAQIKNIEQSLQTVAGVSKVALV
jgi:GTP pyrophosphokinase